MDGIMNENQLTNVKESEFDKPLIQKTDSLIDKCYRDCHRNYSHTFEAKCEYDVKLTNITNNEIINKTISDKSMGFNELNRKLTVVRQRGYLFNQINKLTIKIYSDLQSKNLCYCLKHRIPRCHRLFSRRISQNNEYLENFCNDLNIPFHFACRKWYLDNQTL